MDELELMKARLSFADFRVKHQESRIFQYQRMSVVFAVVFVVCLFLQPGPALTLGSLVGWFGSYAALRAARKNHELHLSNLREAYQRYDGYVINEMEKGFGS